MARALELAGRALNTTHPNPRVGCVLVRDGVVVGEGWHEVAGGPHAEVVALRAAGAAARGATAYVTLEPCCHTGRTPPCTDALVGAGISRVVYAAPDPDPRVAGGGARVLAGAGIAVSAGLLEAQARALNPGFESRLRRRRPWIRCKIAASLDGRTALASGASRWITGEAARADVQRLRARCDAILTGSGTVLADDPQLTVRSAFTAPLRQPLRIVLDSRLRVSPSARLFSEAGPLLLLATEAGVPRREALEAAGAELALLPADETGRLRIDAVIQALAARELNEVLVEAGPSLNGALLAAGLVDELVVYQAAHVLGAGARGMFSLPALERMDDRPSFRLAEVRRVGDDLRLVYLAGES
ncbi:MAG: bifunctional diaminohydroxyphosphoribosylaminopyrimidine deaminase/5-amino-6-(5-phosphoribosylamino)uracil reductase RibD [Chromatiales bacterium]|nr:bifunctional diaminohydroxyphosphoribosylaminopyrimidine deaminase/5-amino-6-(5-phosphoribosylamino)uracil reductase RibD [Chromatiales bacterium]